MVEYEYALSDAELYIALGNMSVIMSTFRACVVYHRVSVSKVIHAPVHFFEVTPVGMCICSTGWYFLYVLHAYWSWTSGRIMNRFSKDMNAIDHELYVWVFNVVTGVFIVIG